MGRTYLRLVAALCLLSGCAAHTAPAVEPEAQQSYTIPFTARHGDLVCVETNDLSVHPCIEVGRLRVLLLSATTAP